MENVHEERKNGYYLTYENLKYHYQITLKKLFIFLDKNFKHQNKKKIFKCFIPKGSAIQ